MQNNIFLKSLSDETDESTPDETEKFTVTKDKNWKNLLRNIRIFKCNNQVSRDLILTLLELVMPFTPMVHSYIASTPLEMSENKDFLTF